MFGEAAYLVTSVASACGLASAFVVPRARSYLHSPWPILALGAVLLVASSRYRVMRQMRLRGTLPAAIYPHRDPILGIDWLWRIVCAEGRSVLLDTLHQLFTQSIATTFWANMLGKWLIFTCEPRNLETVLAEQFHVWEIDDMHQQSLAPLIGNHAIFTANGREWSQIRALIRPSFVRNQIADLGCIDRHVENFLARLRPAGAKVDLQSLFYQFTMDTSTDFMFGHSVDLLARSSVDAVEFAAAFDYVLYTGVSSARFRVLAPLRRGKKFYTSIAICRAYIDRYVANAVKEKEVKDHSHVFMHKLIDSGATHEQTMEQLLALIIGGRDTSASLMSSLFWMLARRPDVVRAIRDELLQLGRSRPTWKQLKNLKYLNNVLKEALRLWPPVALNSRSACTDAVLPKGGGPDGQSPIFVPKGTECVFDTYSMHRRKDIYGEDAEEFRPDRWESLRTRWEYQPFIGGPRVCIGQEFAMTMMSYLTARFFQEFESIEARDKRPMRMKVGATVALEDGCWVAMAPA